MRDIFWGNEGEDHPSIFLKVTDKTSLEGVFTDSRFVLLGVMVFFIPHLNVMLLLKFMAKGAFRSLVTVTFLPKCANFPITMSIRPVTSQGRRQCG